MYKIYKYNNYYTYTTIYIYIYIYIIIIYIYIFEEKEAGTIQTLKGKYTAAKGQLTL